MKGHNIKAPYSIYIGNCRTIRFTAGSKKGSIAVAWRFCRVEYSEAEDLSWQDSASTA
jgi:hypothetical protein